MIIINREKEESEPEDEEPQRGGNSTGGRRGQLYTSTILYFTRIHSPYITSPQRDHLSVRMRHIKPSSMGVSLVVILPLLWKGITCRPGYSIQVSPGVSVQDCQRVTIPCNFTADYRNTFRNSFGYWTAHNEGYIVATNDKSRNVKKTNFHLTGNPDTGDCTLTITDAGKEDEGRYYYGFVDSEDRAVRYNYHRQVIIIITVNGTTCQVTHVPEYAIRVSSSVSVQEGLCVTIPCTFTADARNTFSNSNGYWMKLLIPYSSVETVATNDKSRDVKKKNFHLTGNPDTGDCTLTITDARKEDEGEYYYVFTEREGRKVFYVYYYREMTTTITVPDLTEEPVISDLGTLTAGIEKTVTCSPPGNCSTTSLVFQWKKSDVSGIWKNSSTVTFTPSLDDHQKTITCEMTNSKGKTTRKTIVLDVCCYLSEEPVISDLGTLAAGIEKTVTCAPPGNCSETSLVFQWKKSDVSGIWKNSPTITFTPSIDDHQKTITCEMTNSKGKTTRKTIVLDVCCHPSVTITWEIFGEKKRNTLDSIRVDEGSSVTLRCSVQSDLTHNVTWTDGKNKVLQHGTGKDLELRLENMTMNHTGTYTCSALNKYVINSANISITVQYPPRNMEITIHSSKGKEHPVSSQVDIDQTETLTLVCRADGNPPVTVVWMRGGDDTETSIMINNGLSAEINVTSSMSDVYRCSAWNVLGLREQRIQVGTIHGGNREQRTRGFKSRHIRHPALFHHRFY